MAAGAGESESQEVERILSYIEDLVGVLRVSTDRDGIAQVGAGARRLLSASRSESDDLELQIKEYQIKTDSCKEKNDKAKVQTIADDELNALQSKMEEKLQEEKQLREELMLQYELDDLDRQRVSIKERVDAVRQNKKDKQRAERMLSMCLSVTNIVPSLEDQDKVSGYIIVDHNRKKFECFEFENTTPPVEICDELWKKI